MNYSPYQKIINGFIKEYTFKQALVVLCLSLVLSSISYQFFDLFSALGFVSGALILLIIGILNTLFAKYFSNYFFSILINPKYKLNQLSLTAFVEIILSSLISTITLLVFYNFTGSTHGVILFLLGATLVSVFFHLGGLIYSSSLNLGFNLLVPSDVKIRKEDVKLLKTTSSVISRSLKVSSYLTDFTLSNLFIITTLILFGLIQLPLINNNNYTLVLGLISFYAVGVFVFQHTIKHELCRLVTSNINDFVSDTKQLKIFKRFLTKTKLNLASFFMLIKMFSLFSITVVFYSKVSAPQSSVSITELAGLVTGGLLVFVYLYLFSKQLNNLTNHFTTNTTKQLKRLIRLKHNKERIDLNNIFSLMIFKNQQKLIIPILTAISVTFVIHFYIGISYIFGALVGVIFGAVIMSLLLEYNQSIVSESQVEVKNRLNYLPTNAIHSILELMILMSLIFSRVYR